MQEEMSPEEAKASLGLATRLSEQHLMQQMAQEQAMMGDMSMEEGEAQPEAPVEPQEAPEQELEPEMEEAPETEETDDTEADIASMKTDIELLKRLALEDGQTNGTE